MTSRNAYTALTPDYADFAIRGGPSSSAGLKFSTPSVDIAEDQPVSKWRAKYLALRRIVNKNAGLLLVTASQAFFSAMNVAVKKLNNIDPPVSTFELILVRMSITYFCSIAYMLHAKIPDPFFGPKGVRLLLWFRGFSGFFGLIGIYYSLLYLSLSDATVLTFLSPLCTGIAGALFLGEKFYRKEAFASIFSLIGVILIARPVFLFRGAGPSFASSATDPSTPDSSEKGTPEERLVAVGVALIGVLGSTGAYVSIRAIGDRAHALHPMTSFSFQSVFVATVGMIITKTSFIIPTQWDWLALLIMIGIFGFFAQILLTMGLQRETAGRGSLAIYTQVVFATILERIFFKTLPSVLSIIGTLIIITSALYVALTKDQEEHIKPSVVRLGGVHEEVLEEGLLEQHIDSEVPKRVPAENVETVETTALAPAQATLGVVKPST